MPEFLFVPLGNAVKEDQVHFRKLTTTPVGVARQVIAHGTLFDALAAQIQEWLDLPTVDFPDIEADTPEKIEDAAKYCREYWGLGTSGPITNMTRVAENAGAIVTNFDGISEKVDALSMSRPRPLIVRSNLKESACRLRFDIAHECAHLILHKGIETGNRETERQANYFAGAFLLPKESFINEFPVQNRINWSRLYKLKLRWKVSVRALIRRAYELELIGDIAYRKANVFLSKSGQTKVERYDDQIELESPELLSTALQTLNNAYKFDVNDIAESIQLKKNTFIRLVGHEAVKHLGDNPIPENVVPFARYQSQDYP